MSEAARVEKEGERAEQVSDAIAQPASAASGACANCTTERKNIMSLIHDSEMEDFEAAIVAAAFEVDDFNVVPREDGPRAKG